MYFLWRNEHEWIKFVDRTEKVDKNKGAVIVEEISSIINRKLCFAPDNQKSVLGARLLQYSWL